MFGNAARDFPKYGYHLISKDHQDEFDEQEKNLELISTHVANLKHISTSLQTELGEQSDLLDDVGQQMDRVDSKMNATMIKLRKVLRLSDDKRQWTLIGILLIAILVVIVLFKVLP